MSNRKKVKQLTAKQKKQQYIKSLRSQFALMDELEKMEQELTK